MMFSMRRCVNFNSCTLHELCGVTVNINRFDDLKPEVSVALRKVAPNSDSLSLSPKRWTGMLNFDKISS